MFGRAYAEWQLDAFDQLNYPCKFKKCLTLDIQQIFSSVGMRKFRLNRLNRVQIAIG